MAILQNLDQSKPHEAESKQARLVFLSGLDSTTVLQIDSVQILHVTVAHIVVMNHSAAPTPCRSSALVHGAQCKSVDD